MKKLIITLLCLAIVGGGGWFGYKSYMKSKDDKKIVDVVPVSLMMVGGDAFDYSSREFSGNIVSANSQKIYVDTDKLVSKVCVKKGDTVKKGDVILEYDMTVVELELAKKENEVAVIEQNIKLAKRQIEEYKKYKPAEDAPKDPDYPDDPDFPDYPDYPDDPDFPDEPDYPDYPEEPEIPEKLEDRLLPSTEPAEGSGRKDDPYVFNCTYETVIAPGFMFKLLGSGSYAELRVYSQEKGYLYKWFITPYSIDRSLKQELSAGAGIELDEENGTISFVGGKDIILPGRLDISSQPSRRSQPEDDSYGFEDAQYQESEDVPAAPGAADEDSAENNDYVYTRAQIKRMISDKENDIKSLELDLKAKKMEVENAKKQQSDGRVLAEIDGVVKKIGTVSGETAEDETEEYGDEEYMDYEDYSMSDESFAIIEGDGGIEAVISVPELKLSDVEPGTVININSWETGSYGTAEVTYVEEEPASYEYQSWSDNPNNSLYRVHARVLDSDLFNVGDWVDCSLDREARSTGSVYLPIHYVRQEGGSYYIMKDDGTGHLVKQYIRVGKIMYGYYIEVKGGLSSKDKICFPYGTDVKEGVKTQDSDQVLYPSDY